MEKTHIPGNPFLISLFWTPPALNLIFLVLTPLLGVESGYISLLFRSSILNVALAAVLSLMYARTGSFGLSLITSIILFLVLGFLPGAMFAPYLIIAITLLICRDQAGALLQRQHLVFFGYSLVAIAVVFLPYFGLNFAQPFNEFELMGNTLHSDTLYHLAIAAMIKNFMVVSHGLHGLGDLEYHFGSHVLLASFGNLANTSIFDAYSYLYVFVVVPLLGVSVIAIAEELEPSADLMDWKKRLLIYVLILLGSGVLLPVGLLNSFALWPSFFSSESYSVSLLFLLALLSVLLTLRSTSEVSILRLSVSGAAMVILVLFATASKISTGFICLGLIGSWALLSGERVLSWAWNYRWVLLLVASILFLLLFGMINPSMADASVDPLQFIATYVTVPLPLFLKVPFFLVIHFLFPLAGLLVCWRYHRAAGFGVIPAWLLLGLVGSLLLGMGVGLLLSVQGGSGFYFTNLSMFVALPLLLLIPGLFRDVIDRHHKIVKPLVVILLFVHGTPAIGYGLYNYATGMSADPETTVFSAYIEKLRMVREMDTDGLSLVYIQRDERYWEKMHQTPPDYNACRALTYTIPAISEMPAMYSWPNRACYEFLCGNRFHSNGLCEASEQIYSRRELLEEAHDLGFLRVFRITDESIDTIE